MRKLNTLWASRPFVAALTGLLLCSARAYAEHPENIKQFAQRELAKDIARANLHKVYFPDFIDHSGNPSVLGTHLAALLSAYVAEKAKTFTVISRPESRKYLTNNGWTEHDLYSPGICAKFTSEFQPDAIIWGTTNLEQGLILIGLVARSPSGNELFRADYQQPLDSVFQADIDATQARMTYFFPGLDGVTIPRCVECPIPQYPAALRSSGVEGI